MRTAVDSSVLLDVFTGAGPFLQASQNALRRAISEGSLIAGEVVWAEVRASFPSNNEFEEAMNRLGVQYCPSPESAALEAGRAWSAYRQAGGKRQQLIPDFLVASHALMLADRLLTRDRGFSKRYFKKLDVWDPSV
ncbi:MAG: PIN domain-containing protein [Acidobacteria bacterium]|nr:MAG: PIN domain-containing protein [Acidobacteriota bacterium]